MKKAVLFLMCAFIFSSCYDVNAPEEETLITGSWLLFRVSGGLMGQTTEISPELRNRIVFTKGGIVSYYSKAGVIRSTSFTLKKGRSIYSAEEKNFIYFADEPESPMVIYSVNRDTLILSDNSFDGYSFAYLKEKY